MRIYLVMLVSRYQDVYLNKTIIRKNNPLWPNLGCAFMPINMVADLIKWGRGGNVKKLYTLATLLKL